MRLIQISVTSVWLLRAVEMDFARGKIRNRWLMMGILLGVVLWIPGMKEAGFPELLGGLLLPVLICWIPFRMRGLGAGDIKLLCVVGCLNGSRDIIYCICISFLLAAGFSFGRLLNRKQFRTSMRSCIQYLICKSWCCISMNDWGKVPGWNCWNTGKYQSNRKFGK